MNLNLTRKALVSMNPELIHPEAHDLSTHPKLKRRRKLGQQSLATKLIFFLLYTMVFSCFPAAMRAQQRWTETQANEWYAKQPWLVGADYLPSNASNQFEMWQASTFDAATNDRELGYAESIGMNTVRVFLHDLLWEQDQQGLVKRMDAFLSIAQKHHIRPIFVLFDSCGDPYPKLGPQDPPIPGVHNSRWLQSPGTTGLADPAQAPRLEAFVKGVVGAFATDQRVFAWDLWNEPDNVSDDSVRKGDPKNKDELILALLPQVYRWARSQKPIQPLTSGVWRGDGSKPLTLSPVAQVQVDESDIISFHNYSWPENFEARVKDFERFHRPLLCTEYMARPLGSTFDTILPIAKKYNVGMINWGLVAGRTQTYYPWESTEHPYVHGDPPIWFHDVFYPDGKPYRQREVDIIRSLTGRGE
jgi:hypothetical protein